MKKYLFLLLVLFSFSVFSADVDIWRHASKFTITNYPWAYSVDPNDAPYGSWFGFPGAATNRINMSIHLGTEVPAGNYTAFIETLDYDVNWETEMSIGGGTPVTNYTTSRDWNGKWSLGSLMNAPSSFTNINISWIKSPAAANKTRIFGVVLTSDTNATMLYNSHYLNMITNSYIDSSAADNLNLIKNGSFECGLSGGWGLFSNERTVDLNSVWDPTVAADGRSSLRIIVTNGQILQFIHKPITTKTNKKYVFSYWAKSSSLMNFLIQMKNTITAPTNTNFSATLLTNRSVSVGTNWTRVAITNIIRDYPYSDVILLVSVQGLSTPTTNWFDKFKFSNEDDTNYVSESPVELGFWTGRNAQIYHINEPATVPIKLHNTTSGSLNGRIIVKAYDINNNEVLNTNCYYLLAGHSTNSVYVTLPSKQGHFRLIAYDPSINGGSPDELTISILPVVRPVDVNVSKFGSHASSQEWIWQTYTNMGMQWVRSLSPGAYFRWSLVEEDPGVYNWYDDEISLINQYGIRQLGNISITASDWALRTFFRLTNLVGSFIEGETVRTGTNTGVLVKLLVSTNFTGNALMLSNRIGTFASGNSVTGDSSGAIADISGTVRTSISALDAWPRYLTNLISHYTTVTNWEIGNEPNQSTVYLGQDSGLYSEFLREAVRVISSLQPNSEIVGLGGVLATNWAGTVLSNMTLCGAISNIGKVSFHWYPGNEGLAKETVELMSNGWNKVVMNTESGVWDSGGFSFWNSNQRREGKAVELFRDADRYYLGLGYNASTLLRNHLESLGDGAVRVFSYDSRTVLNPGYYDTEPTMFDYNDSLKPVGVVLAVAINMIDGFNTLGRCITNSNLRGYTWDGGVGTNTIVTLHSRILTNFYTVTMPSTLTNYIRYDTYGNAIGTNESEFSLTYHPIYLSFTNTSMYVHTNMANAIFSVATDTTAPNPVLTIWPVIPAQTNAQTIPIRWFALDNFDKPNSGLTADAITYSLKLLPIITNWEYKAGNTILDISGYDPGLYTLTISATDSQGNSNQTTPQSFWIGSPIYSSGTANTTTIPIIYNK